jgi:hypothetical protein
VPLRYQSHTDYAELSDDDVLLVDDPSPDHPLSFYIDRDGREYLSADTRAWWAKQPKQPHKD